MFKLKKFNYKELGNKEKELSEEINAKNDIKKERKAMIISALITFVPLCLLCLLIISFITMLIFGVFDK